MLKLHWNHNEGMVKTDTTQVSWFVISWKCILTTTMYNYVNFKRRSSAESILYFIMMSHLPMKKLILEDG